jgi:hypothetical protein
VNSNPVAMKDLTLVTSIRFWSAVFLGALAALVALPLIVLNLWILFMAGTASAVNRELLGPNNHPFLWVFWAPPIVALASILLTPANRTRAAVLLLGLWPLLLALLNSLFFLPPAGPVHIKGGMVHVQKADGSPAGGAEISLSHPGTAAELAGKTGEDGSFWLQGITVIEGRKSSIFVSWQEPGGEPAQTGFESGGQLAFPLTIRLSKN